MIELNAAEGKPYTDAVIAASNKDGGWVHIVYVPISAADRATYPAKQFIDKRIGIQDAEKRIGTIRHFLNERGQSVECVAFAAAHQGLLIGSKLEAPNLVTPDVDGDDMANGEDYTAPLPVAPYVPKKKRGSDIE